MERKLNLDDPPPAGLWAVAMQAGDGTFGVSFGNGPEVIGFVVEDLLPQLLTQLEAEKNTEQAEVVREAIAALPRFKAKLRLEKNSQVN